MKQMGGDAWIVNWVVIGGVAVGSFAIAPAALAEIMPDNTLPSPSSVPPGCTICTIDGGTQRGDNLFHSFTEFSVPMGGEAVFNNLDSIEHIFSRITGDSVSNIDGLIRANGTANLFLLNPNGIIFGPNAQLNIGGSFIASTADAIQFGDRGFFSAVNPESPALLTINPSAFLFNQIANQQPFSIENQGLLSVPEGQSIILLGGNPFPPSADTAGILIDGGDLLKGLIAPEGHIELTAISGPGTIGLNLDEGSFWRLSVPDEIPRADIFLDNRAQINTRAGGDGSIVINAKSLSLAGGSIITAGINAADSIDRQAGDIDINAATQVNLVEGSFISNSVLLSGGSHAGNINLTTNSLTLNGGAFISSSTFGDNGGNAGDVTVVANDGISVIGNGFLATSTFGSGNAGNLTIQEGGQIVLDRTDNQAPGPTGFFSTAQFGGSGNGGDIHISADSLTVLNGATISALTSGQGNAGNISIQVEGTAFFKGTNRVDDPRRQGSSSGVYTDAEVRGEGQGGVIDFTAKTLVMDDGAVLSAGTRINAGGGEIIVNVNRLELLGGSQLVATASSDGKAGDITVNATDQVIISGRDPTFAERLASSLPGVVTQDGPNSGLFAQTQGAEKAGDIQLNVANQILLEEGAQILASTTAGSSGEGGNIDIQTSQLTIRDGSSIAVNNDGASNAGDIRLIVDSLILENNASISAETASNTGGNIILDVNHLLLLRHGSQISTDAGIAQGTGNGGDITIYMPDGFLVAVSEENSDITANAFQGRGGNVNITALGIFGIEPREKLTELSDITASSEFGISGSIQINNPDVDPGQGLTELPTTVVDVSRLVAQGCNQLTTRAQGFRGEFYNTGRGGIVTPPTDVLGSDDILEDLQPPSSWQANAPTNGPITEAQGWLINDAGEIMLVAEPPQLASQQRCWR